MARSTFALSSLALLSLAGCVDNADGAVLILQNQVPDSGCNVAGTPTTSYLATGVIEGSSPEGYVLTPVLKNYSTLNELGNDEQQKIAFIRGADVTLRFANSDLFSDAEIDQFRDDGLMRFRVPYSGMIAPGGTTSMIFEIVPADLLNAIGDALPTDDPGERVVLLADVTVDGNLGAGGFETPEFRFPVEVCNGCLTNVVGACGALPTSFSPSNTGGECNPTQDGVVDCCTDGSNLVCPAVGTMTASVQ